MGAGSADGGPVVTRDRIVAAHRCAVAFYRAHLGRDSDAAGYVRRRLGVLPRGWPLGYAPAEGVALVRQLRRRRFTSEEMLGAGLAICTARGQVIDRFRRRIMFPLYDQVGDPVGFLARVVGDPSGAKYVNTPTTAMYRKGGVLYGLWEQRQALAMGARPVVVEGPMDALAVSVSGDGQLAGVAVGGTAVSATQVTMVASLPGARQGLVSAFDDDPAGQRARLALWNLLRQYPQHRAVARAARLPGGTDPAGVLRAAGRGGLRRALGTGATPLVDAVVDAVVCVPGVDMTAVDLPTRFAALERAAVIVADSRRAEDITRLVLYLTRQLDLLPATVTAAVCDAVTSDIAGALP